MIQKIVARKLKSLPINPGVYLFKNSAGEVLYVGKAKRLNQRVRSYFAQSHNHEPRTQLLVANIADLDYVLCDTEVEALMLENNLIKKYQPRYNVLLRDDKNYQFIKIDYSTEIPQIYTTRKISEKSVISNQQSAVSSQSKNSQHQTQSSPLPATTYQLQPKYFGPYTSGFAVRQTLRLIRYIFPYCSEKKIGLRPCFYYHLGRCPGVCAGIMSLDEYHATFKRIERFLKGGIMPTIKDLRKQMKSNAMRKRFEKAARLRDQIRALKSVLEKQKIVSPKGESHDVVASVQAGSLAAATVLQIRAGKLIGTENFLLTNTRGASLKEVLAAFLDKYYSETSDVPPEIDLPLHIADPALLQDLLHQRAEKQVRVLIPSRGRKHKLIEMAEMNSQKFLETSSQNLQKEQAIITQAMFELKNRLGLSEPPFRIEAYDISNLQGTSPTGSMVVFENGKPKKSGYKRFAVRSPETPNDFAMMEEVLTRRLAHSVERTAGSSSTSPTLISRRSTLNATPSWPLPDLIIIDGGKGQLAVGVKVLKSYGLKIPIIGLAKRLEEIFLPGHKTSLRLPADSPALHLLQRIRDEAHRFAITYHRKTRSKQLLQG